MREVTLEQARQRLREMTGTEHDDHLGNEELNRIIASAAAETWDLILSSGLAEQFTKKTRFVTVPGQLEYDLDAEDGPIHTCQNFYKVHALYVDEGNGHLRPIQRVNQAEVVFFKAPQSATPIVLHYIPPAPTFRDAMGSWCDEATFEGFNGWEEHSLATAAISICMKKKDDFNQFYRRKKDLEQRVQGVSNTDWSGPSRVVRRHRTNRYNNRFFPFTMTVTAWNVIGGKLELYSNDTAPYA
jgi:hypothetical protein